MCLRLQSLLVKALSRLQLLVLVSEHHADCQISHIHSELLHTCRFILGGGNGRSGALVGWPMLGDIRGQQPSFVHVATTPSLVVWIPVSVLQVRTCLNLELAGIGLFQPVSSGVACQAKHMHPHKQTHHEV